jgi:hypothetical protein
VTESLDLGGEEGGDSIYLALPRHVKRIVSALVQGDQQMRAGVAVGNGQARGGHFVGGDYTHTHAHIPLLAGFSYPHFSRGRRWGAPEWVVGWKESLLRCFGEVEVPPGMMLTAASLADSRSVIARRNHGTGKLAGSGVSEMVTVVV